MSKDTKATTVAGFTKFINPDINFVKSAPVNLSSKELEVVTENLLEVLSSKGLQFKTHSHLSWSIEKDFDWNETVKPEVHSFFIWRWYINVSSNGTVYYKNNGKFNTIASIKEWVVSFNDSGKKLIPELIKEQQSRIEVKS